MKIYEINAGAFATLKNGEKTFVPMNILIESNTKNIDAKSLIDKAKLEFRTLYDIKEVGKSYKVGKHPATHISGVKFNADSIYKVEDYGTNIIIYYTDKYGEEDTLNTGCYSEEYKKEFFAILGIVA